MDESKKEKRIISPQELLRYCEGKSSLEEACQIELACQNSIQLKEELDSLQQCVDLRNDLCELEDTDSLFFLKRDLKRIQQQSLKKMRVLVMRYAAFLSFPLLLTSILFSYLFFSRISSDTKAYAEINTATGVITRYELPDKTIVWLNSGSKLRYPLHFSEEKREVELDGEGYFKVKSDQEHPFYVKTPKGLKVYVYGTRFNVNAYSDNSWIETTLERGKVNVILPNRKSEIVLQPGEGIKYDEYNRKLMKSTVDVYEKTAWKDGKIIFRNATVAAIFKRLSRHFNVDIEVVNPEKNQGRYRATFTNETLNQILTYFSRSVKMKWKEHKAIQLSDESYKRKVTITLF